MKSNKYLIHLIIFKLSYILFLYVLKKEKSILRLYFVANFNFNFNNFIKLNSKFLYQLKLIHGKIKLESCLESQLTILKIQLIKNLK